MKNIMTFLTLALIGISSFAGNGGGTMDPKSFRGDTSVFQTSTAPNQPSRPSAILKYEGMDRAEIVFQYGVPNKYNDVYTNQFKLRPEEIKSAELIKALKASMQSGEWKAIE